MAGSSLHRLTDVHDRLHQRPVDSLSRVEFRILPTLVSLREAVVASTLEFSIIRWRNASAQQC
jgi:hypothetical protein